MGGNPQWLPDGSGFFYKQDKEMLTEEDKNSAFEDSKVMLHLLHSDTKRDKEIFSRTLNKEYNLEKIDIPMLFTFPTSDKVLINIQKGTNQFYSIFYGNLHEILNKPAETVNWTKICDADQKIGSNVLYNNLFFSLSYSSNPNGQLIMMHLPSLEPKVLFEGSNFAIEDMVLTLGGLYITSLENGINKLVKIDLKKYTSVYCELPFSGGITLRPFFPIVSYFQQCNSLLFGYSAFNKPWDMYLCDSLNKIQKTNFYKELTSDNLIKDIVVEEIQVPSYDGVMVPLSIVYKKGILLNGTNPTIINAYGAYGTSIKSEYDRERLAWFNKGGIYAVAHVRGGGEKGYNWYKGGFKENKSNSWKDLISCSEYLIKNNYTSSKKLALFGGSAGGITLGMAITERPDLFKAAVIYVGLLNAIRIENSFNTANITEFGTTKDSVEFQYLMNMDVYHHIREKVTYPSILFTASLNDSRVAHWLPAKAVASMQQVGKNDNIILFRIDDGGHFSYPSGADIYSFLLWQLGHGDFKFKHSPFLFK